MMSHKTTMDPETLGGLEVLRYPDPRLREVAEPLRPEDLDESFLALVERMHELMAERRGVGLAATQVGVPLRVFGANPPGEAADRRTYVNPRITSFEGTVVNEEGCLSVPGVNTKIKRHAKVTLEAMELAGRAVRVEAEGLLARIFQHETDHLDGRLLIDRMGTVARLSHRVAIKQLEEDHADERKAAAR
jgi:peptide deformylase